MKTKELEIESIPVMGGDEIFHCFLKPDDEYALCGHKFIEGNLVPTDEVLPHQLCSTCEERNIALGYPSGR